MTHHLVILSLLLVLSLAGSAGWAADHRETGNPEKVERKPLPMPEVGQGNVPEPEVTITTSGKNTRVEEYRIDGRLYMIKIVPAKGFPYYLIDTDGDGILDSRRNDLEAGPVNQWILFQW